MGLTALIMLAIFLVLLATALVIQHFLDGRNYIIDALQRLRLAGRSLRQWDTYRMSNGARTDISISFTTIPERIEEVADTLKSLMAQDLAPAQIELWVPRKSRRTHGGYAIPDWLSELKSIEIHRCEDWGPATKFLPKLRKAKPNDRLLIVDDDKIYPRQFVSQIAHAAQQHAEVALCYSGWKVPSDLIDRPTTLWMNIRRRPPAPVKSPWVSNLHKIDIMQGYSGYLVQPRFFDLNSLADYSKAPEAAFFVDDVWISAHCKAEKFVIPGRRFCMEPTRNRRLYSLTSLGLLNRGNGDPNRRNNTIMMRYFENSWGTEET
jgi:hypothetical protein